MNYIETIKCDDMEVFNIEYHQKRISNTIGKNIFLLDYIYPPTSQLLKCKIIYNEDEIISVLYDEYIKKDIKKLKILHDDNLNYKYKYENRAEINKLLLQKEIADDIIILQNGFITDTSIANIAIFVNNQWVTPKKPLLLGTTRQRYIDNELLKEIDIDIELFKKAEKIALLNAMIDFDVIDNLEVLF
jgi:4-amino-4-deoxychorismate lyase